MGTFVFDEMNEAEGSAGCLAHQSWPSFVADLKEDAGLLQAGCQTAAGTAASVLSFEGVAFAVVGAAGLMGEMEAADGECLQVVVAAEVAVNAVESWVVCLG